MCPDTTKYAHFLVVKGFYDWKYALERPRSRPVTMYSVFWGVKIHFYGGQGFCSYYALKKVFWAVSTNFGRAQKILGETAPPCLQAC